MEFDLARPSGPKIPAQIQPNLPAGKRLARGSYGEYVMVRRPPTPEIVRVMPWVISVG